MAARVLGAAVSGDAGVVLRSDIGHARGAAMRPLRLPSHSYIVEAESTDQRPRAPWPPPAAKSSRASASSTPSKPSSPTPQHAARARQPRGVKQITPNAPITTQAAASVRDNFETGSFANNDGTHRWYGDWVEQNDDNNPYGGKVTIGWNDRGGNRLILSWQRRHLSPRRHALELAAASRSSSSTLRAGLEAGEYVSVQASGNGGATWTEVGRISGPANDTGFINQSYNITAYRGRNTAIRFVASMSEPLRRRQRRHRRLEITYTTTFGEGDPVPVDVNAQRPPHRRHPRPRRRRRRHRHRLLETRFARQGFAAATAAWRRSTTPSTTCVQTHLVVGLHRHQRPRHAHHQPHRQQPQEQQRPATSASRPMRASSRSRHSAKTARAAMPP